MSILSANHFLLYNIELFAINNAKLVSYYKKYMDFEELPEEMEASVVNNLVTEYTEKCKFLYQAIDIM